jgi:hypothetical protein
MAIMTVRLRSYPAVPTRKCGLQWKSCRDISYVSHPLASDDIIDCMEIQTNHYRLADTRQTRYPMGTDGCTLGKGAFIDLWI